LTTSAVNTPPMWQCRYTVRVAYLRVRKNQPVHCSSILVICIAHMKTDRQTEVNCISYAIVIVHCLETFSSIVQLYILSARNLSRTTGACNWIHTPRTSANSTTSSLRCSHPHLVMNCTSSSHINQCTNTAPSNQLIQIC